MIKAAIAEPNSKYAKKVKQLLKQFISLRGLSVKVDYISSKAYKRNKINENYNVVFLDTDLPNCLEMTRKLKSLNSYIKIVFVSEGMFDDKKNIELALTGYDLGISGFILKTYADNEVLNMFSYVFRLPVSNFS